MSEHDLDAFRISATHAVKSLFDEFERLSVWNSAYQQAMAHVSDPKAVETRVKHLVNEHYTLLAPQKYSDLRQQAIRAVESQNPAEFAGLIQQVKARIAVWGGTLSE